MRKLLVAAAAVIALSLCACGSKEAPTVYVQSVKDITNTGSTGLVDRYAGLVSVQDEIKINNDSGSEIGEILVKAGDEVKAGDILFRFDTEQMSINIEKAWLELEKLNNQLASFQSEKASLEAEKAKAPENQQLSYSLEINECDTDILETTYNISLKQKEIEQMQTTLENSSVACDVDGRVRSVNAQGGFDNYGNPLPLITIVQNTSYRIKGYVNENNIQFLYEGMDVIVRSRIDSSTWTGTISMIDWENPVQNAGEVYYYDTGDSEMSSSSKYPFYVELDDSDGLMLGQHVYIEPDYGQEDVIDDGSLRLPEWYIEDADSDAWVWAENNKNRLEKRPVTLGAYDENFGTYVIVSGLDENDYIAFPDGTLEEGALCTDSYEELADYGDDFEDYGMDGGYGMGEDYDMDGGYGIDEVLPDGVYYEEDMSYEGAEDFAPEDAHSAEEGE